MEKSEREPLTIWIDADACPQGIKEVLFRTSRRLQLRLILVANQSIRVPVSPRIQVITVSDGADIADDYIAEQMQSGDIVITSDIPLAARVVDNQGIAIGTRGELFDDTSIHSRLASRNLMEQFRAAGEQTKGPRPFDNRDLQTFANTLDRVIVKQLKKRD